VGEPGLDLIKELDYMSAQELAGEFNLDLAQPVILATQHPVTTEVAQAEWQMRQVLDALEELDLQTVFTYPTRMPVAGEMTAALESRRDHGFLRIVPDLGSRTYLSLMRIAAAVVGNSSSGIIEAPSFKVPAVNIGTRQHGRLRARNVVDVGYEKAEIVRGVRYALADREFRAALEGCTIRTVTAMQPQDGRDPGTRAREPGPAGEVDGDGRELSYLRFEILTDDDPDARGGGRSSTGCRRRCAIFIFSRNTERSTGHLRPRAVPRVLEDGPRCVVQPFVKRPLNDLPFLREQG